MNIKEDAVNLFLLFSNQPKVIRESELKKKLLIIWSTDILSNDINQVEQVTLICCQTVSEKSSSGSISPGKETIFLRKSIIINKFPR